MRDRHLSGKKQNGTGKVFFIKQAIKRHGSILHKKTFGLGFSSFPAYCVAVTLARLDGGRGTNALRLAVCVSIFWNLCGHAAAGYEIAGEYIWRHVADSHQSGTSKTNAFTIEISTNSYKIQTIDIASGLPCYAFYNGEDVAALVTGTEVGDPKTKIEMATEETGSRPMHAAMAIRALWLCYSAGIPGRDAKDILKDIPFFRVWQDQPVVSLNSAVQIKNGPIIFVTNAVLYCSPDLSTKPNIREILSSPFDKGFLCASYKVLEWKMFDEGRFPSLSTYEVSYAADQTAPNQAKGPDDVRLVNRFEIITTNVKAMTNNIAPISCQDKITWLDDYRFLDNKYSMPRRITNGVWLRLSDLNLPKNWEGLKNQEIDRRDRLAREGATEPYTFKYSKLVFLLLFGLLSLAAPVLMLKSGSKGRQPSKL